jgi:cytochrome c-type biogenesis protein CcmF
MIPELGSFSMILALCLAVLLSVLPIWGSYRNNHQLMAMAAPLTTGLFTFTAIAFALLLVALVGDDFSVNYIAANSNSQLQVRYKISAAWGGHEGSLLLWVLILAGWALAVATFSRSLPLVMRARVLAVMGMIATGFLLFVLLTSNPFARTLPYFPAEGNDLNPLLQDIGLIFHPPMLYLGYVGFAVPFAFAIAALLGGRLDAAWARWSRPWTNLAWACLTLGITLGSWWAYYELGWGGWWFWDPVENASFMPWLMGTALVHSLAVTDKRGVFRSWTVLLAIFTFSLSLLGTFLVRSGVLTSVHAFAADPSRGMFILVFLFLVVGGSLLLFALRAPQVSQSARLKFLSLESFLMLNNVILLVATLTVLFGTLFPIVADALDLGKYSVGAPYFNAVFLPMMLVLMVFMGPVTWVSWKETRDFSWQKTLLLPAVVAVLVGLLFPAAYAGDFNWKAAIGTSFGAWVLLHTLAGVIVKARLARRGVAGLSRLSRSYWGMVLGHIGFAVVAFGVTLTTQFSEERDIRLEPGQSATMLDYVFTLDTVTAVQGPNYIAEMGLVTVSLDDKVIATLRPEKRRYAASGQVMTEAGIDAGLFRDLYLSLGEKLEGGAWAVRVQVKPFVRWLWLGGILIALGGSLAVTDRRYRKKIVARAPLRAGTATATATVVAR